MDFKKAFTPKDVEELRPNFFVQRRGDNYRQVQPLVWNGEWRLRNQIKLRKILMIALIIALFFTGSKYVRFYEDVNSDPTAFCENVSAINIREVDYEDTSTIPSDFREVEWYVP
jgi:hypothetical protein